MKKILYIILILAVSVVFVGCGGTQEVFLTDYEIEDMEIEQSETQPVERMVFITPHGERYHLAGCRTIEDSRVVNEVSLNEAREDGRTACRVCRP